MYTKFQGWLKKNEAGEVSYNVILRPSHLPLTPSPPQQKYVLNI